MNRAFLSRLSGAVVALALGTTTLAAVGAATPASAAPTAVPCTSTVAVFTSYTRTEFGASNSVTASTNATCADGKSGRVSNGAIQLFQSLDGGRSWAPVASGANAYASYSHTATANALFRAHYAGGSLGTTYTFSAADSANVGLTVLRDVDMKFRGGRGSVKTTFIVKPASSIAGVKALVQIKKGKHWKKYKRVKFRANGRYVGKFGKTGRYRLVLPTTRGLTGYTYGFRIWRY
jgi:hypothetical protein